MLAQQWLYGNREPSKLDGYVEAYLRLPDMFNPKVPYAVLNRLAERIVFTDDVPSLLYELCDNRQMTLTGMLGSVPLPFDSFWLEYRTQIGLNGIAASGAYGALVQKIKKHIDDERVRMVVLSGADYLDGDTNSGVLFAVEFLEWPPVPRKMADGKMGFTFATYYSRYREEDHTPKPDISHEQATTEMGQILTEIIFGIFLVTQPRCYTDAEVKYGERKQEHRRKNGKPPLLEYRRIKMHIGRAEKRYTRSAGVRAMAAAMTGDTDSEAAVQHRRYHKVMGHFRHYTEKNPHSVWIAPHYRGDPKLGVVFTERDVVRA